MVDENTQLDGAEEEISEEGSSEEEKVSKEEEGSKDVKAEATDKAKDSKTDKASDEAPENYEDFTLPEKMEEDKELLEKALPVFKELNLSQEQAQKLVNLQTEYIQEAAKEQQDVWEKTKEDWRDEAKNDKEFGGAAFDENVALAKKGRDAFGSTEFNNMLDITGAGDHPEMVRFLIKAGKAVSEHEILQGTQHTGSPNDRAKRMFPDMN